MQHTARVSMAVHHVLLFPRPAALSFSLCPFLARALPQLSAARAKNAVQWPEARLISASYAGTWSAIFVCTAAFEGLKVLPLMSTCSMQPSFNLLARHAFSVRVSQGVSLCARLSLRGCLSVCISLCVSVSLRASLAVRMSLCGGRSLSGYLSVGLSLSRLDLRTRPHALARTHA